MQRYKLKTFTQKLLADRITPVNAYLKLRDQYANSILLESSEYQSRDNHFSYICCKPIATFQVKHGIVTQTFPDNSTERMDLRSANALTDALNAFTRRFETETAGPVSHVQNGLFGFVAYDALPYVEDISLRARENVTPVVPDVSYSVYQYVIAIDHFRQTLYLYEHVPDLTERGSLDHLIRILESSNAAQYPFTAEDSEASSLTDDQFEDLINKGKAHCRRGDVFQIVLSRAFTQRFTGDEFNVYRALRAVNPSPYLFFFDYGSFTLFGSSPEAQLTVHNNIAAIHPIAGTYRRTGENTADLALANKLIEDPKENAEHIMLVDLARNDLNRSAQDVRVATFRELQYYSHVIHLVSKVTGTVRNEDILQLAGNTFPAGTLSGAPKYRAIQLIDEYEPTARTFYGGAIGFIGFNGSYNHAIMIRTFCSQNNVLHYQAGAGIVDKSIPASEVEEVNHKIGALRAAIQSARQL